LLPFLLTTKLEALEMFHEIVVAKVALPVVGLADIETTGASVQLATPA
jgi:hypothetical protein